MYIVRPRLLLLCLLASLLSHLACSNGRTEPSRSERLTDAAGTPGVVLGITTGKGTFHRKAQGVRVQGKEQAVTVDDVWAIGSVTKSMTAALAATLVERGQLSWTDRVVKVVPGLAGALPAYQDVTLEDLLAHRGGILQDDDFFCVQATLPPLQGDIHTMRVQITQWALRQPPRHAPRTTGHYSNLGYVVAAAMMEEVMGEPWEQAVFSRLLAPLGIQAGLGRPAEGGGPQPWGHEMEGAAWQPQDPERPLSILEQVALPAGVNLNMRLESALAWTRVHLRGLQGHDSPVLKAETLTSSPP